MTEKDIFYMIQNGELELWTSSDVAKEIGYTRQTAHRLMRTGRIASFYVGNIWLTVKECVKEFKK